MPVRFLTSSVLEWPDREEVDRAVRRWAVAEAGRHRSLLRLGYFGSSALEAETVWVYPKP